ncbi:hypothetical protein ERO13_D10G031100v2 [Gossypium hirsutum]|uniref:Protein IQ-DOMAIN 1 isoform X2 n=1 Tax=Gossypium hirsutum TaxID=3635 RepID=A0A1U8HJI1_GOSHI|nr:protein IQ-DOMAIN 1 isoform X2 [Gossypium hirsutum]XP_040958706.1 protein IQ-DOMAIN 1 isoform X2 [Gossypium hirsutum]KAG4124295.1 hypothetical protein ERO13_D10G031100v2 [Gossypium hirsutum]KAG4124296.1 hypothetical protein ERO13_D10G031100v2 [Gossypium hirsutum]
MGSGNVLKTLVNIVKDDSSKQVKRSSASTKSKGFKWKKLQRKTSMRTKFIRDSAALGMSIEDLAATRIQTAFRAYRVEWSGGPGTMEEVLTKIHQKEAAAVKRERTMAYAFSHQWRAPNSINNGLGSYKLAKANWGWSWVERWIAVRPWERRLPTPSTTPKSTPKEPQNKQTSKGGKNSNSPKPKASVSVKPPLSNAKGAMKPRRLSYPGAEKPAARQVNTKADKINIEKEEIST